MSADALETQIKGQRCVRCDSVPRVAYIRGELRIRCNCLTPDGVPDQPDLVRVRTRHHGYGIFEITKER